MPRDRGQLSATPAPVGRVPNEMQVDVCRKVFSSHCLDSEMMSLYRVESTHNQQVEPFLTQLGWARKLAPIHALHAVGYNHRATRVRLSVVCPKVFGNVAYRGTGDPRSYAVRQVIEPVAPCANWAASHRLGQPVLGLYHCKRVPSACQRAEDRRLVAMDMNDVDSMLLEYLSEPSGSGQQGTVTIGQDDRLDPLPTRLDG